MVTAAVVQDGLDGLIAVRIISKARPCAKLTGMIEADLAPISRSCLIARDDIAVELRQERGVARGEQRDLSPVCTACIAACKASCNFARSLHGEGTYQNHKTGLMIPPGPR